MPGLPAHRLFDDLPLRMSTEKHTNTRSNKCSNEPAWPCGGSQSTSSLKHFATGSTRKVEKIGHCWTQCPSDRVRSNHLVCLTGCMHNLWSNWLPREPSRSSLRAMPTRAVGNAPRSWLQEDLGEGARTDFGRIDEDLLIWKRARTAHDRASLAAAKVQHRVAQALAVLIVRRGKDIADVAAEIGMSATHLGRILNGRAHVTLTDLVRIAEVLDRDLSVAFNERSRSRSAAAASARDKK